MFLDEYHQRDIRRTEHYSKANALHVALRRPGAGLISEAADLRVSSSGQYAVFAGTLFDALHGGPLLRICQVDIESGELRVLTWGPNSDRQPKFSPNGRHMAFLSDRHAKGDFQLYLLDAQSGAVTPTSPVSGWVEYFHWSPDSARILLGVAGHGAHISGGQGAISSRQASSTLPSSAPSVETGDESFLWRQAWVYELATDEAHRVSLRGDNIWEAVWCGKSAAVAIMSAGPGEGLWYSAHLRLLDIPSGDTRDLYVPRDQIGLPTVSPSGRHIALIEAICSDRWIVAGQLRFVDAASGAVISPDTSGVDITFLEWQSDEILLLAGHRGFETVVGFVDVVRGTFNETWDSRDVTTGGFYASVAALSSPGDCVLVGEGFMRAPEIAAIEKGQYRTVRSLDLGYSHYHGAISTVQPLIWNAPDGLEIHGWLLLPRGSPPYPLIMVVHGGPVSHWRPMWLGGIRTVAPALSLLMEGYAVFLPNPRGSSGRGQTFIRHVVGDMGGADTYDFLSGLDCLVKRGVADPRRIGVIGSSYGGFMTSWLITQDSRFAAAVSRSPATNRVTDYLLSDIPQFVHLFLAARYSSAPGKYSRLSPVMHAHKARTPTLNICGALDRCTPPTEAIQFHHALLANSVRSELVTYPEEGHGVRTYPAIIDYTARVLAWFEEHMPAQGASRE